MNNLEQLTKGIQHSLAVPSVPDADPHAVVRYGFTLGTWSLLFDPARSSELLDRDQLCPLPNSAPWFVGLANVRGTLTPVFDLEMALLETDSLSQDRKLLVIGARSRSAALIIGEMPHRFAVDSRSAVIAASPPEADPISEFVSAAYRFDQRSWLELDYGRLFEELCARGAL